MRTTVPVLSEGQLDVIEEWGSRRKGVTAPEVADHFDIPHLAAWRSIQRLVRRGRLYRTDRSRRRAFIHTAGRGATIYKTKPHHKEENCDDEAV